MRVQTIGQKKRLDGVMNLGEVYPKGRECKWLSIRSSSGKVRRFFLCPASAENIAILFKHLKSAGYEKVLGADGIYNLVKKGGE